MKRHFKRALSCVLILAIFLSFGVIPAFAGETPKTEAELKAEINELYASEPGSLGRLHKMQAFIMELALHAKSINPDFKIIPQDGINLAFEDGDWSKGVQESLISLVDGWGIEGMVGNASGTTPNETQQKYMTLVAEGLMVTDTTTCRTQTQLDNYYARAEAWGIIPYPRIGQRNNDKLAQELFPGWRWADNGDYFWVEDPVKIGLESRIDSERDVIKLTDAKNYLYNINSRPYDAWDTWDAEEAVYEKGDGDRTRITDSYGCGLLVPSEGGEYQPVGTAATVEDAISKHGEEWDWWWREAGLDEDAGRETWLNALRNSDYDVIYIDSFYNHRAKPEDQTPLTKEEIDSLKYKPDGGRRQVIAYLSIGSAEQNRWYCQDDWVLYDDNPNSERSMKAGTVTGSGAAAVYSPPESGAPEWLAMGYGGNYAEEAIVQWWHPAWRDIIINGSGEYAHKTTGDNTSSIDRIINQGFDGVYLDNVGVYSRANWAQFETYWLANGGIPGEVSVAPLAPQDLDYTENPIDIPNPDRGFYRANDGMVVPVSGADPKTMNVGNTPTTVGGAQVTTRISHVYFDLRNFSSNAFTSRGTPYNEGYRAPENVAIGSRGDDNPEYATHFDYWKENVLPTWPHGESQPLTEDALAYIRDKLQQVRDGNGVTLVRFNYDGRGFGWVDVDHDDDGYVDRPIADIEPDKDTLLGHIAQLKPILHEYEDVIMGVDGGMFGPWGEMHSTTFGTSPEAYAWLLNAWLDAVPESRSIIVQGGAFLSWYNAAYGKNYTFEDIDKIPAPKRGTPEARFGFFNDSYGYGEDEGDNYPNDWGSLSEGAGWPGDPLGDEDAYDRGRVMTWIRKQNNFYGGEAQGDETRWNTYPFVAWEASYAQTVYLNADYEKAVHSRWGAFTYTAENVGVKMTNAYEDPYKTEYAIFDPVYEGKTGAEYWRDRLGYRLVLREAKASEWVAQNGTLQFEGKIQNVGFGNIVNKKNVSVILKSKTDGESYTALTSLDARDWQPDLDSRASNTAAYRNLNFLINLSAFGELPLGDYDIYLKINDPKELSANKRSIRFANNGTDIWDVDLGANLIGSTTVNPAQPFGDDAEILFAQAAIENAEYTTTQSKAGTEAKALSRINEILDTLELRGVSTDVSKVSYTAAVAGTSSNRTGTNGSYVFTVTLNKGLGTEVVTQELTLTITATRYVSDGGVTTPAEPEHGFIGGSVYAQGSDLALTHVTEKSFSSFSGAKVDGKTLTKDVDYKAVSSSTKITLLADYLDTLSVGKHTLTVSFTDGVTISDTFTVVEERWTNPFTDVGENAWYYGAVEYAYTHGLMTGTSASQFGPNLAMTRGMLATVLYRLAGEPAVGTNGFTDVSAGQYYTNAVTWAVQTGVVTGMGDNLFAPDSEITREQLATMLYRFAGSPAVSGTLSGFDDVNQVSDWAKQALTWAVGQGIIQGRTVNTLAPGANATRAEVAAMLQRFIAATTTA